MPGMPEILGMNLLLEPRLLAALVKRSRTSKYAYRVTPSVTSEQIIDDRHGKNPCMLTKIENVTKMSSVAESWGGFKIQNFLTWMREFSLNSL